MLVREGTIVNATPRLFTLFSLANMVLARELNPFLAVCRTDAQQT